MNVPGVNWYQWHPFSIASSPNNPYLILMIKMNGDWTRNFISKLYQCKLKALNIDKLNFEGLDKQDVFNVLLKMDDKSELNFNRTKFYPTVHISRAITSPA